VVTENGVAYLMGIVNEREAKVAVAIARTTDGVRKVVNVMEVVPRPTPADRPTMVGAADAASTAAPGNSLTAKGCADLIPFPLSRTAPVETAP
jgi:hypothetical protein